MADDLHDPEEQHLHSVFGHLRSTWVAVSDRFNVELRRRLEHEASTSQGELPPDRLMRGTFVELINVLRRMFTASEGAERADTDDHDAKPEDQ